MQTNIVPQTEAIIIFVIVRQRNTIIINTVHVSRISLIQVLNQFVSRPLKLLEQKTMSVPQDY